MIDQGMDEFRLVSSHVWDRFIKLITKETFGEPEILLSGKRVRNLIGSAEWHKKLFDKAVEEVLHEIN